jgi:Ca-activated chloride channel family protein
MSLVGLSGLPLALLFGSGCLLMVLLYLLKLRRRRVLVPFTPLWAQVASKRQSSALLQRLKRPLSFLVQLVLFALLVLALSNPTPEGAGGCGFSAIEAPSQGHTLLLLDDSASMSTMDQGLSRFEQALDKADEVVQSLTTNPSHRIMVATADTRLRPLTLWTTDREEIQRALREVRQRGTRDTATDMSTVVGLAQQVVAGREHGQIILVTDTAYGQLDEEMLEKGHTKVLTVGRSGVNLGIAAFNVRPYLDDSLTYALYLAVANHSKQDLDATVFIYANEEGFSTADFVSEKRIVASFAITIGAQDVNRTVIRDLHFEGSRLAARVQVSPHEAVHDVFPRDDLAFALVPERKRLRVQLVTEGNLFLHASLLVRENVDFEVLPAAEYRGPDGFDLTVLDGVDVDISQSGHYVVIHPKAESEWATGKELLLPQVQSFNKDHALTRRLRFTDLGIQRASLLKQQPGDEIVVKARNGAPLILTRNDLTTDRTVVVFAFDLRHSLLPLSYAFPLLVVNTLNWFQQQPDGFLPTYRAGAELSFTATLKPGDVTVRGPQKHSPPTAHFIGERIHFVAEEIGVYELWTPESEKSFTVAINLMDQAESRINPQGDYPLWVLPEPYHPPSQPWPGTPWRALLIAALVMVVLEWLTWHRRITV